LHIFIFQWVHTSRDTRNFSKVHDYTSISLSSLLYWDCFTFFVCWNYYFFNHWLHHKECHLLASRLAKVYGHFGYTCCLHIQGRGVSRRGKDPSKTVHCLPFSIATLWNLILLDLLYTRWALFRLSLILYDLKDLFRWILWLLLLILFIVIFIYNPKLDSARHGYVTIAINVINRLGSFENVKYLRTAIISRNICITACYVIKYAET
jgi:hypothetical protein